MSTLSKLFSGYMGSGQIVKNGKFSTTKNNHNRDKHNRPKLIHGYSVKYLKYYIGENYIKTILLDHYGCINRAIACSDKKPSYMNPIYHRAYHQPKRTH